MTAPKTRRSLLQGATVLGLSLGIAPLAITRASAAVFIKLEGVEGEARSQSSQDWVEAEIRGKRLMLKSKSGEVAAAIQGTFTLKDGRVITVKKGVIVRK